MYWEAGRRPTPPPPLPTPRLPTPQLPTPWFALVEERRERQGPPAAESCCQTHLESAEAQALPEPNCQTQLESAEVQALLEPSCPTQPPKSVPPPALLEPSCPTQPKSVPPPALLRSAPVQDRQTHLRISEIMIV